jgi:hypothetical protein
LTRSRSRPRNRASPCRPEPIRGPRRLSEPKKNTHERCVMLRRRSPTLLRTRRAGPGMRAQTCSSGILPPRPQIGGGDGVCSAAGPSRRRKPPGRRTRRPNEPKPSSRPTRR